MSLKPTSPSMATARQLAFLALLAVAYSRAFQLPSSTFIIGERRLSPIDNNSPAPIHRSIINDHNKNNGSTKLQASLVPSIITKSISKISPPIRNSILVGAVAIFLYKKAKNFPAPYDKAFNEPLPPGSLGCPLLGNLGFFTMIGDTETGAGKFYRYSASKSGSPSLFKFAPLGSPTAIVSGMSNVKKVFNKEFKLVKTGVISEGFTEFFGGESLLFVTDQERHQYMRRLVGQSMTPEQINYAMPALLQSASEQIDTLEVGKDSEMEDVLTRFTLDVAWRQILGLDLKDDEIETFNKAVNDWIGGILNPLISLMPVGKKLTKTGKAFNYLVSKIERKLESLQEKGPDGSTMSGMYFARDEEDPSKRLSKEEIISNALLLILAGSETAASTLTVAMLCLGLHKDVLQKLKDEQLAMIAKHNTKEMTREMLEKDCPYLDAFIKETMRIKPLATTGAMRFAQETFVVDGKQIPKGYGVGFNPYITHSLDPAVKEDNDAHMDVVKGFKPERWLDDKTKPTPLPKPTEYMPWGVGPRFCLGYNLAMAEMKVFLALFARKVDFNLTNTTPDNIEWKKVSIIPKPLDGALISVTSLSSDPGVSVTTERSPVSV